MDAIRNTAASPARCCICLDTPIGFAQLRPCNHRAFCLTCVGRWLHQVPNCPLCKTEVVTLLYEADGETAEVETAIEDLADIVPPAALHTGIGEATDDGDDMLLALEDLEDFETDEANDTDGVSSADRASRAGGVAEAEDAVDAGENPGTGSANGTPGAPPVAMGSAQSMLRRNDSLTNDPASLFPRRIAEAVRTTLLQGTGGPASPGAAYVRQNVTAMVLGAIFEHGDDQARLCELLLPWLGDATEALVGRVLAAVTQTINTMGPLWISTDGRVVLGERAPVAGDGVVYGPTAMPTSDPASAPVFLSAPTSPSVRVPSLGSAPGSAGVFGQASASPAPSRRRRPWRREHDSDSDPLPDDDPSPTVHTSDFTTANESEDESDEAFLTALLRRRRSRRRRLRESRRARTVVVRAPRRSSRRRSRTSAPPASPSLVPTYPRTPASSPAPSPAPSPIPSPALPAACSPPLTSVGARSTPPTLSPVTPTGPSTSWPPTPSPVFSTAASFVSFTSPAPSPPPSSPLSTPSPAPAPSFPSPAPSTPGPSPSPAKNGVAVQTETAQDLMAGPSTPNTPAPALPRPHCPIPVPASAVAWCQRFCRGLNGFTTSSQLGAPRPSPPPLTGPWSLRSRLSSATNVSADGRRSDTSDSDPDVYGGVAAWARRQLAARLCRQAMEACVPEPDRPPHPPAPAPPPLTGPWTLRPRADNGLVRSPPVRRRRIVLESDSDESCILID